MEIKTTLKEFCEMFTQPDFSVKDAKKLNDKLNYHKINGWEGKNLISPSRTNEKKSGWRKFTFIDLVKLFIISDLKEFGMESSSIEKILLAIETYDIAQFSALVKRDESEPPYSMSIYELIIYLTTFVSKVFFIISNQDTVKIITENSLATDEISKGPHIILPLRPYLVKIFHLLDSETRPVNPDPSLPASDPSIKNVADFIDGLNENKIRKILASHNFQEITIKQRDGIIKSIVTKQVMNKKLTNEEILSAIHQKEYQRVTVVTKDGQTISLVQEEDIRT